MTGPADRRVSPQWATWESTPSEQPPTHKKRRWPLIVGALLVVVLILVTATGIYLWRKRDGLVNVRVPWQPQGQTFLKSSMQVRPVPGWRLSVTDLGLPEGSRIATDPMPIHSHPLVGNIEERAFFLVASGTDTDTIWWLVGVSVDAGQSLFQPVELNRGEEPSCFLNGREALLCVTSDLENRTAWVVNSHSGAVTYSGPTELDIRRNDLNVQQVGIYAVAESVDEGVYGIGPRAEPTWFVPGHGDATPKRVDDLDIEVPTLAYQTTLGFAALGKALFSVPMAE